MDHLNMFLQPIRSREDPGAPRIAARNARRFMESQQMRPILLLALAAPLTKLADDPTLTVNNPNMPLQIRQSESRVRTFVAFEVALQCVLRSHVTFVDLAVFERFAAGFAVG